MHPTPDPNFNFLHIPLRTLRRFIIKTFQRSCAKYLIASGKLLVATVLARVARSMVSALTNVKYHRNVQVPILFNQWLALTNVNYDRNVQLTILFNQWLALTNVNYYGRNVQLTILFNQWLALTNVNYHDRNVQVSIILKQWQQSHFTARLIYKSHFAQLKIPFSFSEFRKIILMLHVAPFSLLIPKIPNRTQQRLLSYLLVFLFFLQSNGSSSVLFQERCLPLLQSLN